MNRKIFTLLASALMLFSTAFYANATVISSDKCVGDTVRSLPDGVSVGMYHIRVDSICVVESSTNMLHWESAASWISSHKPSSLDIDPTDTLVLAAYESSQVGPVSMNSMKGSDITTVADLQATMWCTNVLDPASAGAWPVFHFNNKALDQELDYNSLGTTIVSPYDGWMYSQSYSNGQLNSCQPLYRAGEYKDGKFVSYLNKNNEEVYRVLTYDPANGYLKTAEALISDFVEDTVKYMLKFTIVKASPYVLNAEAINTKIQTEESQDFIQLMFDPEGIGTEAYPNYFGMEIKAEDPVNKGVSAGSKDLGYVSVQLKSNGKYIWNIATSDKDRNERYTNKLTTQFIQIHGDGTKGSEESVKNYDYRFVYFPSEDSLVINAFTVGHFQHTRFGTKVYFDNGVYECDGPTASPYNYGLYNNEIHDNLIVRMQDLNGIEADGGKLMTIGEHPANVRIYFNVGCQQVYNDAIEVDPGVYTIWDNRGRCLGVRIYNGSYSPQWMELAEGECPDRIPSYQWVVTEAKTGSKKRVDIYNREFGNLKDIGKNSIIAMYNVLVRYDKQHKGGYAMFAPQSAKFSYLANEYSEKGQYEPIRNGLLQGQRLDTVSRTDCTVKVGANTGGGFRPVNNVYVNDEYLGYKHFKVGKDESKPDYGKSEDNETEHGMDYNAWIFNYLHNFSNGTSSEENWNISMQPNLSDTILRVEEGEATGFQFFLATEIRGKKYQEETFGYPEKNNFPAHDITWPNDNQYTDLGLSAYITRPKNVHQSEAKVLQRYYYELKVADYYDYRDQLSQQYVVLKGAKNDGSDARNAKKYGVADIWADKDPFKFANIYLRETYFLTKDKVQGEERKSADPSRRVYYSLLDRIVGDQVSTLTSLGLEVSDTLYGPDGTTQYNLVTLSVNDNSAFIEAQGKTVSSARVSAFALLNKNYPLYRRLNSLEDDGANAEGTFKHHGDENFSLGDGNSNLDAPKILRFYRQRNEFADYLSEDARSQYSYGMGPNFDPATVTGGINFLGIRNINTYKEELEPDGTVKNNYNMLVDTAFINRGTGPIKPQYLIGVDPVIVKAQEVHGLDACDSPATYNITSYIRARYLVNATDSARQPGSDGSHTYPVRSFDYINGVDQDNPFISNTSWDRLIFVDAIHVNDRLYIVDMIKALVPNWEAQITVRDVLDTTKVFLDLGRLASLKIEGTDKTIEDYARRKDNSSFIGAYYDFSDWDDYHNDVCFSLRFVRSDAENADVMTGEGGSDNKTKQFLIESETTNRTVFGGGGVGGNEKIAPVQGGWIKLNSGVPVLSRTSYEDAINQAERFNVEKPNNDDSFTKGESTSNEAVSAKVKVIAGYGEVTILNAAGKKVTVSNILGQTVANAVLTSDNATVKVAGGVVVVAIEGEKTVKAIVK